MTKLLSFEQTIHGLECLFKDKKKVELPSNFKASLQQRKFISDDKDNNRGAPEYLEEFCFQNKNLLQISSKIIPDGILPLGYTGILHDMKVKAKGNGPDDKIYKDHPKIQKLIPRGMTTMKLKKELEVKEHDVVIYANRKFTGGGVGDEDDNNNNNVDDFNHTRKRRRKNDDDEEEEEKDNSWQQYFLESPENAVKIICMEKLNGDAVHFSVRYIEGKFYIITGSKNVHLLMGEKKDIETYTEDKYENAKRFARTVWDTLETISEMGREVLYSFLHHTKVTAVCEILQPDYQHIVHLSYLEKPELNLITFTPTASGENNDDVSSLTAFPPHYSLMLGEAFGLPFPSWTVIDSTHLDDHRKIIKGYHDKEGEVLYFLNKDGRTIGISKTKSVWYVFLRALREKSFFTFVVSKKKYPNYNVEDGIKSLDERYDNIMTWLKTPTHCVNEWKVLGAAFMKWLDENIKGEELRVEEMRPKFPVWWKSFLKEKGLDDNFLFCYESAEK